MGEETDLQRSQRLQVLGQPVVDNKPQDDPGHGPRCEYRNHHNLIGVPADTQDISEHPRRFRLLNQFLYRGHLTCRKDGIQRGRDQLAVQGHQHHQAGLDAPDVVVQGRQYGVKIIAGHRVAETEIRRQHACRLGQLLLVLDQ